MMIYSGLHQTKLVSHKSLNYWILFWANYNNHPLDQIDNGTLLGRKKIDSFFLSEILDEFNSLINIISVSVSCLQSVKSLHI